jgi:hypothetical protein
VGLSPLAARYLRRDGRAAQRVARADHFGRTTETVARRFPAGDEFLGRARELMVERRRDVVLGRHLIARTATRARVRRDPTLPRVQDENGWTGADLAQVLGG